MGEARSRVGVCLLPVVACIVSTVVLATPAAAQAPRGRLEVLVTDVQGGALPGATLRLVALGPDRTRGGTTGPDGSFTFEGLEPGRYEVLGAAPGFAEERQGPLDLTLGGLLRVALALRPQVTDAADAVVVRTESIEIAVSEIASHIDLRELTHQPVGGRGFTQAALVKPGVVPMTSGVNLHGGIRRAGQVFAVNGQRPESNNYLMDGVKIVNRIDGGIAFRLPTEAVGEFEVQTHTPAAEYGGAGGAIASVFTRGGESRLHATAWEYNRQDAFAAKSRFAIEKEPLQQNQFGLTLGGPLSKRLVFFAYYEGLRGRQGVTRGSTVPTPEERAGDFSSLPYALIDPQTGGPFPGNVIPQGRIDPIAARLLRYYPLGNVSSSLHSATRILQEDTDQAGTRLDLQLGGRDSVFVRYAYAHTARKVPFSILGADVPDFPVGDDIETHAATLSHTHVFGQRAVNTLRLGFFRNDFMMEERLSGLTPRSVGLDFDPTLDVAAGMPFILVSGYSSMGDPAIGPRDTLQTNLELNDTFTFTTTSHSVKTGFELRQVAVDTLQGHFANGSYQFSDTPGRSAFANFLLGQPSRFSQTGGDFARRLRSWELAAFLQDDWQIASRLRLNLGLRYEINTPFRELDGKLNAFVPGRQSTVYPDAPEGVLVPGDEGVPDTIAPIDYWCLGPRIGFAWDVRGDGRTSVRSAYGVLYDALANGVGGPLRVATQSVPWVRSRTVNGNVDLEQPFRGESEPFRNGYPPSTSIFTIESGMRPAYTQQWNLVLAQQLGAYSAEARYVGTKGTRLPRFVEGNPAAWEPGATAANADRRRIYSGVEGPGSPVRLGHVALVTNSTSSTYHAGQLTLSGRPLRGLTFTASYTYSKLLDYVSTLHLSGPAPLLTTGENDVAQNPFDLGAEHGPSLFDARHRLTATFTWELPFGRGSSGGVWRALVRDWQVSGALMTNSGTPFTVYDSANVSMQAPHPPLSGVFADRPDLVGDPNAGPHTSEEWVSRDAFRRLDPVAEAGQFGDAGRNIVRGPGYFNLDLVIARNVFFAGGRSLQLRIEVFNATNRVNLGLPVDDLASPNFGRILDAGPARVVQFGLRLQV